MANPSKHVLFIGGHDETFQHYDGLPFRFTCLQRPQSVGPNLQGLTSAIHPIEDFDTDRIVAQSCALHAQDPFDFILSFTEDGLLPSAVAADTLGVPGIDLHACGLCIDKSLMRTHLQHTRFALPHQECSTLSDALAFLASCPDGAIFKPFRGAGSEGVFHAKERATLEQHFAERAANAGALLAEAYIGGRMFSVETLTIRGQHEVVAITAVELEPGTLVPIQHLLPAPEYDGVDQAAISEFCIGLLDEIGYKHGPCHIELKVSADRIALIEINNRVGGDLLGHLAHLTKGVNMYRETIEFLFEGLPSPAYRASQKKFEFGASRSFRQMVSVDALKTVLANVHVDKMLLDENAQAAPHFRSTDDRLGPVVFATNSGVAFNDAVDAIKRLVAQAPAV